MGFQIEITLEFAIKVRFQDAVASGTCLDNNNNICGHSAKKQYANDNN